PPPKLRPAGRCGVRSAHWLNYAEDLIFEVLPETLTRIYKSDRHGSVLIEADADPHLRHVYPYDRRIFIMPAPEALTDVFRTVDEAADALKNVLDDTATFAREIYGMLDSDESNLADDGEHEDRPAFTIRQMRGFLNSPLGDELATRIQFQPAYHGLVESDVVLINTGVGGTSPVVDECVHRLERLLARLHGASSRKNVLFCCDPVDRKDPLRKKLLKALKNLLQNHD
ncbi:MAG: hypothetical protein IID40_03600, partial [Planctomycetes bacterium]|nr:hypothetical protein [Planctomycetota bacterium]